MGLKSQFNLCSRLAEVAEAASEFGTPLHVAVSRGWIDVAQALIQKGANVNAIVTGDMTPLHYAALEKEDVAVQASTLLLEAGADPNCCDVFGSSPLITAAEKGYSALVALLIERGAKVTHASRSGRTALHAASATGCIEAALNLVQRGADPLAKNSDGQTPIDLAEKAGHRQLADLLRKGKGKAVTQKAAVRVKCPTCGTLLIVPKEAWGKRGRCKRCQAVFLIGGRGASPPAAAAAAPSAPSLTEVKDCIRRVLGYSGLFFADEPPSYQVVVRASDAAVPLILEAVTDLSQSENTESEFKARARLCQALGEIGTPHATAALKQVILEHRHVWEYSNIVRPAAREAWAAITRKTSEPSWRVSHRESSDAAEALRKAAGGGDLAEVERLLGAGTDVNAQDNNGLTALHLAAGSDEPEICDLLIRTGANLETESNGGYTPLSWAVLRRGGPEVVKVLLAHGANMNCGASAGKKPLTIALIGGRSEIAEFLKAAGARAG